MRGTSLDNIESSETRSRRELKLARTLRRIIAEEAICFAQKEPEMYQTLINQTHRDKGANIIPEVPKAKLSEASLSEFSNPLVSPRTIDTENDFHNSKPLSKISADKAEPSSSVDSAAYSDWHIVHLYVFTSILSMGNFTQVYHLSLVWGSYVVLIPYALAFAILVFPLISLEAMMGNLVRGPFPRCLETISPGFRGVSILAWFILLWTAVHQSTAAGRAGFTILQLFSPNPLWIPTSTTRLECEQTRPEIGACTSKYGCMYRNNVCTLDPVYWVG